MQWNSLNGKELTMDTAQGLLHNKCSWQFSAAPRCLRIAGGPQISFYCSQGPVDAQVQQCHESISTHWAPWSPLSALQGHHQAPWILLQQSSDTFLIHTPVLRPTTLINHLSHLPFTHIAPSAFTASRMRARGCSSQLKSPSVPQEGPHHHPCPNTSPSAGVPWAAAVSCHVCSVPLVGGTASPLPWGTSCHTFALGFKPAPFDVTCWRDHNTLVSWVVSQSLRIQARKYRWI